MEKNSTWRFWDCGIDLKHYTVQTMKQNINGDVEFFISSCMNDAKYIISFNSVEFLSYKDESNSARLFSDLIERYGRKFLSDSDFYVVEGSELLDFWYKHEIVINSKEELTQYCFMSDEGVWDIITTDTPEIKKV